MVLLSQEMEKLRSLAAKSKIFGYVRVSAKDQNIDRQIMLLKEAGVDERNIFIDKMTGKRMDRPAYKTLLTHLRKGDTLVICEVNRLGRTDDYTEIADQYKMIIKEIGAHIIVLDMPILNRIGVREGIDIEFVQNMIVSILSYVGTKERITKAEARDQGIRAAKAKGVKFGRKSLEFPPNWDEVLARWEKKEVSAVQAVKDLGLPNREAFYKLKKRAGQGKLPL